MSDDAKKIVLARRARFFVAAFAGVSLACGKDRAPEPCLSVTAPNEDAAPPATPMPCLTVTQTPPPPPSPPVRDGGKKACGCEPNDPLCTCLP